MQIKLKKINNDGIARLESKTQIRDVFINTEIVDSNEESIAIAFKGTNDSGFIELSRSEINFLYKKLNLKKHLIGNL